MEQNSDLSLAIINDKLQKGFNTKLCAVPDNMKKDCAGKIIKAHTISKCLGLSSIAINGKVCGLQKSNLHEIDKNNGEFKLVELGVQQASILQCFCSKHDKEIFSKIENLDFQVTSEQCFLLAYRAFTSEYYKTIVSPVPDIFSENIDKIFNSLMQDTPDYIDRNEILKSWKDNLLNQDSYLKGVEYKKRDLEIDKKTFDYILLNKDFLKMRHYIFEGDKVSNVVCSFTLNPNISFNNKIIQNYFCPDYVASVYINSISRNDKSYVIFSWINEDYNNTIIENFFGKLRDLDNNKIENDILEFIFKNCENTYFSINWFKSLHQTQKKYLKNWIQPRANRELNNSDHKIRFMNLQKHYLLNT